MEAPAPASALIHSATLVSAGLFLYIKFMVIYKYTPNFNLFVLILSTITVVFGSVISATQTDLKRLLAYSTISNCGLLFVSAVLSNLNTTMYLFQFHGLTKSLSFLYVGFIIIIYNHNQDIRLIGSQNFLLKLLFVNQILVLSYLSAWF
jgi:NADH:ubiquinone oxidoreductase subunit 5 (subunit L)/multisubunit Na+/H+ antiporter MnhA subunit